MLVFNEIIDIALTSKMGCDEKERRPEESEADPNGSFSFNLRYDTGGDCSMFQLCRSKAT